MYDVRIWLWNVIIKFYIHIHILFFFFSSFIEILTYNTVVHVHILSEVNFSMKFTVSNILLIFEPAQNYFKFGEFFELGISGIFPSRRMFIMFLL